MTGVIILAAGSSSRLGQPKQNLIYQGQTLLQKTIETAIAAGCSPVMVVLGANAEVISPTIKNLPATIIHNPAWQQGMASSISLGIARLQKTAPQVTSVILMLADQPFVNPQLISELIKAQTQKGIVACAYNGTTGAPVLFNKIYFNELLLLKGHEGAKKLLSKYAGDVFTIPFALGSIDIDTAEDYEGLSTL